MQKQDNHIQLCMLLFSYILQPIILNSKTHLMHFISRIYFRKNMIKN